MNFNSSARFNRKAFNSEKLFDMGIHDAGTVTNSAGGEAVNDIVNGGFETGDFTGWTPYIDPFYTEAAYEVSANPRSGSWAAKLTAMYSAGPGGHVTITQDAPNSNNTLTFYYKTTNWNWIGAAITVKISDGVNPDITDNITTTAGVYTLKSYDITSLTNRDTTCNITLGCYCLAMPNTLIVYFDDVSSTHNAPETFEMEFQFTHERTVENSPALTMELAPANITATVENSPEEWCSVFIDTTPVFSVPFDGGSSEIIVGETVTGATSGATGTVTLVVVTGGTWGGGDAEGYILIDTASGVFENNEEIDGSTSGNDAVEVNGDMTRITPKVIEKSCWKSIDEVYWQASLLLDGLYAFSDVAGFKELYIDMPDHTATSQRVFYGFIPNQGIVQNPADNTTRLTAYSHAYNLANQFIPDEYRDTVEWVPSGASGYVTFSDPSVPITAFLGGALWNLTTGIQPQNILTITDWGTSDIPIRGFAWGPEVNKWQAIQEMADYCGYVFEVLYDSSLEHAVAEFCAVDDIDTYIGTPAAVTFDKDDAAKYVLNVSKERRGTEMINRVRVQGRRNKRILNFVDGVTEFTAGHTVVDGLTGAEATIISCTKTAGAWGGTAIGYLIISYDRTGDFVHDSTIIDALGAGFGQATMQGNSVIYETYDECTHSVESPAVTNLEERARERFFQLEEEYDSTPLIEAKCLAYYDMYALDPTPYNVTFRDRCDLRLWQKVKLTSFTEIPEDWMRIVSIRYTQRSGGAVDVSCTLNNADYVIAQRKMRRSLKNNDVTEIEKIVKAILAKKEVKVGEAMKVQGEGITIELQDGGRVVVGRAPE